MVSSGPWKTWNEESPGISNDSLVRTLQTLKIPFSDFQADPETCLSGNRIWLIIKYWKIVLKKILYAEIWTPKNGEKLGEKP